MQDYVDSQLWYDDLPAWVRAVARVRKSMETGSPVWAIIGDYNGVPAGTVVAVSFKSPDPLAPRHPDGSLEQPGAPPCGYSLADGSGAWGYVAWSGGGFYNRHRLVFGDRPKDGDTSWLQLQEQSTHAS